MRNFSKKLITIVTAGVLALGAGALSACDASFTPLDGDFSSGEVVSNGGFVVEKGSYVYFINGVEAYTADNTYGTPVKGSLMRISKSDLEAGVNSAETVIPSLMVAADYSSGIYIFGDRVYYATPNNVRNTSGVIESEYLDFKSARLDGSDIQSYFNVADNATVYRYMEVEGTVYLVYESDSELHSYNTGNKTDTVLAKDVTEYVVDTAASGTPYVYYTMGVTMDIDVEGSSLAREYNQIYRVRADATEAPYEYSYSEEYLEEHDGEEPYWNLGEIVLDGIGATYVNSPTQFTHDLEEGVTPLSYAGYTYTLQAYSNGGLYFTRTDLAQTGSTGEGGWLYYLSADELGSGWNSVSGNGAEYLDVVAQTTDHAGTAAIFYLDDAGAHHYLYVDGSNIFRADVTETGTETTLIARGATDAVLVSVDDTSSDEYAYVYYTVSGDSGSNICRAVYNGTEEDYRILGYEDNAPFAPVQLLDIEHAGSWYNFEIVDGTLFFADAETIGNTSYNYISAFSLKNESGAMMDNSELKALNEEYENIVGEEGVIESSADDVGENMPTALRYYFFMGQDDVFYAAAEKYSDREYDFADGYLTYDSTAFAHNIQNAIDEGKKDTYLYSTEEQEYFKGFVEDGDDLGEARTRSRFIRRIGAMSESDFDAIEAYWEGALEHYSVTEEESGLPAWAWALIGVGIGIVVVGAGLAVFFILRAKKNKEGGGDEPKMYVDTTDDRSVDVYADDLAGEETASENASAETPAEAEEIPAAPTGEVAASEDAAAGEAVEESAAPDEEGAEAEETDGDKDLDSDDEEAAPADEAVAPTDEAAEEEKN